jgi:hypothetical protein
MLCFLIEFIQHYNAQPGVAEQYSLYDDFSEAKCVLTDMELFCLKFTTWPQLIKLINSTAITNSAIAYITHVSAKSNEPILLTGEMNLWLICNLMNPQSPPSCTSSFYVYISGLKGIDFVSGGWASLTNNNAYPKYFSITIYSSVIEFIYMGEKAGKYNCSTEHQFINEFKRNLTNTFFNYFDHVAFSKSVIFTHTVCPFIFANSELSVLEINGQAASFIVTNLFKFQNTSFSTSTSINSTVNELDLNGYNYKIDSFLIHPLVFEQIRTLMIYGSVFAIQHDVFKPFLYLNDVTVNVFSLKNFFHQAGVTGWTGYFNYLTWIVFRETVSHIAPWLDPGGIYKYPDKDLCIFATFPLNSVIPVLDSNLTLCTNTVTWLIQSYHSHNVLENPDFTENSNPLRIFIVCWDKNRSNMTEIGRKISQCLVNSHLNGSDKQFVDDYKLYTDYNDIVYVLQFLVDLSDFVLIPMACILGFLLNLRVIWIVYKNRAVELKENFYSYMSLNSVFNCIFCLIYSFYPINFCLQYESGFFCSTIYNSIAAQVVKIVVQTYFGECLKMCSNISYIFITINRYMLIGKEHNPTLDSLSKWEMKQVIAVTIAFSLLMNIGHCFQYRINYGWGQLFTSHYLTYDLYPSIVVLNSAFHVYSILYFFVNFVVFLALNTWVEASLVQKIRHEIADKRMKMENEIRVTVSHNASHSAIVNKVLKAKQHKIEQDAKKETRAIVMVITNSGVNFFLRLPEILVFFSSDFYLMQSLFFNNDGDSSYSRFVSNFSNMIVSFSYLFYILTFTANVAMYYLFNANFKQLFILWEHNVKKK